MRSLEKPAIALALLGALVFAAYGGVLGASFTFDDRGLVLENEQVRKGQWGALLRSSYWEGREGVKDGLYRPLSTLSLALNYALSGIEPRSYHLFNLVLHAASAGALLLVARRFLPPASALAAGLFFALHPALSEAVCPVVGRSELLAFFLGMAGVHAWLGGRSLLSLPFLLGAALAKENGLCFALALGLAGFLRGGRAWAMPLLAGLLALLAKVLAVGALAPGAVGFIDNPLAYVDGLLRAFNGGRLLVLYLLKFAFPWPLAADYSYDQIPVMRSFAAPAGWLSLLVLGSLGGLWLWRARRSHALWLWGGLSGSALLLVSQIPLAIGTIFAERLLYIPAAGLCLGMGYALGHLSARQRIWILLGWVLVAGALVRARTADWKDDLTLFASAARVSPHSARAHYGLGLALHREGRLEQALGAYGRALAIYPRYAEAWYNRGAALVGQGENERALEAYRRAAEIRPGYARALYAVAVLEVEQGREEAAREALERLLDVEPEHEQGRLLLERLE